MNSQRANILNLIIAALLTAVMASIPVQAAQVLLDAPVRAGDLTLFPSYQDNHIYYYVLDKPRLGEDNSGRKQFSFLRYVNNQRSAANEADATQGEGGGILHALVTLEVTQDQLREAQRALQRVRPGAEIQGPVIYKSGRFALISSFADEQGRFTEKVLGVGSAPILDGQKAAVSLLLTKEGSKVLWQSFHTPTPDISFSFEMELEGYLSPKRGLIEANFEQIYNHEAFNVGLASTYLSGEIKGAFDDLYRKGAIKVTEVGDDEDISKLLEVAYNKLIEAMFQPVGSSGAAGLAGLSAAAGQQQSMLDRATTQLTNSRQEARQENERIRRENRAEEERARQAREAAERNRAGSGSQSDDQGGGNQGDRQAGDPGGEQGGGAEERPERRYSQAQPPDPQQHGADDDGITPRRQQEETVPAFAIVASYEMKRVRQRGIWTIDLNKYTADTLSLRFDENIGDLRRYLGDQTHFRQVNLDDPLYRQREISVFLDGLNGGDFDQFVNYVTVQMRKQHATGDITTDEVRIDRRNFNTEGNAFKLLYGWKQDNDRSHWLNYDYRTQWSFHGGYTVESGWQKANFGAINVSPVIVNRSLQIEADPDLLQAASVRAVTVKVYYTLGDGDRVQQVTLFPAKGELSAAVNYLAPADSFAYDYEVSWLRRGQPSVQSGRQTGTDTILFVDDVPGVQP